MILPSIDLMGGQAVQLIGGKERAIEAGDPRPIAERFRLAGEVAVVDLDAALGKGNNDKVIRDLLRIAPCRVGGGIRDAERALAWLDAGATKVVLGTRAVPEVLEQLPKERVVAALDADKGEVVVEGWQKGTGRGVAERMQELAPYVSGFLVTFVEREGRMGGTDIEQVRVLAKAAGDAELVIAGGVTTPEEIAALDQMGAHAQLGMALYTERLDLGDAIAAPLRSDRPDGLFPTVVVDERGVALGLAYSSQQSLREAVRQRRGVYYSRSRSKLWVKGETSGATQELLRVDLDCDRDAVRFVVRQAGPGFCHLDTPTCWGELSGLAELERKLQSGEATQKPGSYTKRLLEDDALLGAKLEEEGRELAEASERDEVIWEAADLLYFATVKMAKHGVRLADIDDALDRRARKVKRRGGDAKAKHKASTTDEPEGQA